MDAIVTRYQKPTAGKPARIAARTIAAGSASVAYDHALSEKENHIAAARHYLATRKWATLETLQLATGELPNGGWVHVIHYAEAAAPRDLPEVPAAPKVGDAVRGIWGAMHPEWTGKITEMLGENTAVVEWDDWTGAAPREYEITKARTGSGSPVGVWLEAHRAWVLPTGG